MSLSSMLRLCAAAAAAAQLMACAQADPAAGATPPNAQRVLVTTVIEWPSAAEVANRVAQLGGVPVREAMEDAPRRYRLTLMCADEEGCRQAMQRVAAARGFAHSIERDTRQRLPAKPDRDASR